MRHLTLVVPSLAALAAACTEPELGARTDEIIGGAATPAGGFPGVGALLYDVGSGPQTGCTGTLIAPSVVLTAAHCVDPSLGGDALVGFTLDHDTVSALPAMTTIANRRPHEQFSLGNEVKPNELTRWFDIGLVVLAEPITAVAPIKLARPVDSATLVAEADLHIVGYGRTSNDTGDLGVKQDAATKLISTGDWELQVSRGQGQPQNCHGDSGGPALTAVGGRVVGVVSRSFDLTGDCLNGGVHTRVDAYLDWIFAQELTDVPCGSGLSPACAEDDEDDGGCSTGGAPTGWLTVLGVALALATRRRRP